MCISFSLIVALPEVCLDCVLDPLDEVGTVCGPVGEHADNVGVQAVRLVQLRVGGDGNLAGQPGLPLPVPVVDHPEAVVTAVLGKLKVLGASHSEGRVVEENILKRKKLCLSRFQKEIKVILEMEKEFTKI